jgi:uncharacterized protein (TIGR02145 family)
MKINIQIFYIFFLILITSCSSEFTMVDNNGREYETVKIGNQVWMAENLNYPTENESWCYDENPENCEKFGRLYTWEAAINVCPDGWHLPSAEDWNQLTKYLIENSYNFDESKVENKIAKSLADNTMWKNSIKNGAIGNNLEKNNRSKFSALPGGYRYYDGNYYNIGNLGFWWSSTDFPHTEIWYKYLYFLSYDNVYFGIDMPTKWIGASVRCIKDYK